jgi:WD40 repeat protein
VRTLTAHQKRVYALALLPDVRRVCSAGEDLTLLMWDAKNGKLLKKKQAHKELIKVAKAFQRGDQSLLWTGGGDGHARIWTKVTFQTSCSHSNVC